MKLQLSKDIEEYLYEESSKQNKTVSQVIRDIINIHRFTEDKHEYDRRVNEI